MTSTTDYGCTNGGTSYPVLNWTPYNWSLTYAHSYQIRGWNWPSTIAPHTETTMCIYGQNGGDTAGEATYSIVGTPDSFQFQYRTPSDDFADDFIYVLLTNMTVPGHASGSKIVAYEWVLAGEHGHYISSSPPIDWMQQNLVWLGSRSIREITIPGAHDAGMSSASCGGTLANQYNTQTQVLTFRGQLDQGARWFDVRPGIKNGGYTTCHGSQQEVGGKPYFLGCTGEPIANLISDVNSFTAEGNNEIIFLSLSHTFNIDQGARGFNNSEWYALFDLLKGINFRYTAGRSKIGKGTTLDQLKVSDFIGNKTPAVVILVEDGMNVNGYADQGFYTASESFGTSDFPYYNNYADSDNRDTVISDQLSKMAQVRKNPDSGEFLLSWTLTMTTLDSSEAGPPENHNPENSLVIWAQRLWHPLFISMMVNTTADVYPNILLLDSYGSPESSITPSPDFRNDSNAAALSLALAYWALPTC